MTRRWLNFVLVILIAIVVGGTGPRLFELVQLNRAVVMTLPVATDGPVATPSIELLSHTSKRFVWRVYLPPTTASCTYVGFLDSSNLRSTATLRGPRDLVGGSRLMSFDVTTSENGVQFEMLLLNESRTSHKGQAERPELLLFKNIDRCDVEILGDGHKVELKSDEVITLLTIRPRAELLEELKSRGVSTHAIGMLTKPFVLQVGTPEAFVKFRESLAQ